MDRTQFQAMTVPPGGGRWLDACAPFVHPYLSKAAETFKYSLTTVDLEPREPEVLKTDLRIVDESLGEFDLVTSFDTLEHIDDYAAALWSLYRYCRRGGAVVVGVPSLWDAEAIDHAKIDPSNHPHRHEWYFSPVQLGREIESIGLRIIDRWLPNDLKFHQVCCVWFAEKL